MMCAFVMKEGMSVCVYGGGGGGGGADLHGSVCVRCFVFVFVVLFT